jgi:hypothetical protein
MRRHAGIVGVQSKGCLALYGLRLRDRGVLGRIRATGAVQVVETALRNFPQVERWGRELLQILQ